MQNDGVTTGDKTVEVMRFEVHDPDAFDRNHYVERFDALRRILERDRGVPLKMTVDAAPRFNDEDRFWFIAADLEVA